MIRTMVKSSRLRYVFAAILACGLFIVMGQVAMADTYVRVTGSVVNVRSAPEIDPANRITTVPRGTIARVVDEAGDFFRAYFQGIGYAYVAQEWVDFYRTQGTVTAPVAWIFNMPDAYSEYSTPVGFAPEGYTFTVVSYYGYWYGIMFEGELAFIEKQHMYTPSFIAVPRARFRGPNSSIVDEIIEKAKRYLGTPYRWGGNGPNAFDCSGFVIYVLRPFGVTLPRRSRDMAHSGVYVPRNQIQPGDLVFFATAGGRTVSHVALYIGGGQIIHSSSPGTGGVIISNLHNAYFTRTYVTARRVL